MYWQSFLNNQILQYDNTDLFIETMALSKALQNFNQFNSLFWDMFRIFLEHSLIIGSDIGLAVYARAHRTFQGFKQIYDPWKFGVAIAYLVKVLEVYVLVKVFPAPSVTAVEVSFVQATVGSLIVEATQERVTRDPATAFWEVGDSVIPERR